MGARDLPGVDTSDLTAREKQQWWAHVSELLAPCSDQPVSIAQCVREERNCAACKPAAQFLSRQVQLGRTRSQVEAAFRLRFDADGVKEVDPSGSPAKGAAKPTVLIVEWADFECPFCGRAAPELDFVLAAYPEHVRLVYKHFPLLQHKSAEGAARAAVAADLQGKFWPLHDAMYAHASELDLPGIERLALKVGLDTARLERDMQRPETDAVIERDKRQADRLGLQGTPLIVINGRRFDLDFFDIEQDLEPWVKLEIELRTGAPVDPRKVDRSKWPLEEPGRAAAHSAPAVSAGGGGEAPLQAGDPGAPAASSGPARPSALPVAPAPSSSTSPAGVR